MTTLVPALPWYASAVTRGALTSLFALLVVLAPKLATLLGLTSNDVISQTVDNILIVGAAGSALYTLIVRVRSPIQPVTLTQAAADSHPATVIAKLTDIVPLDVPVQTVAGTVFTPSKKAWEVDLNAETKDKPK